MKIIPAIDLLNGKCVRLLKGDYSKVSNYNNNPIDQVQEFIKSGFNYIHLIDLNAAKSGGNENLEIIKTIASINNIKVQVGGGIRDINKIEKLFSYGVDRVIVGTAAITNNTFKIELKNNIPKEKIIYGLDFKIIDKAPLLSVNGWTENTNINLFDYIEENFWIKNILATDISLDGTLEGPNIYMYKQILKNKSLNLIASGGIGSINDINKLRLINSQECVVGKAIYENKISLMELRNAN
ncbi:1-(5-phosphoribosyl)-5-[(5-phosphoribosylamino)methylideneamino]imidazole-4-carboxamide isomerase [Gammaproteobacteria bacterium]|nr:1-(5-phosphoribosyl)-5-[(5-phosphoribosylamino)methylideneamino]imidazole-4-carboxamide isomerase [Gammaproteobacteria bacterium]